MQQMSLIWIISFHCWQTILDKSMPPRSNCPIQNQENKELVDQQQYHSWLLLSWHMAKRNVHKWGHLLHQKSTKGDLFIGHKQFSSTQLIQQRKMGMVLSLRLVIQAFKARILLIRTNGAPLPNNTCFAKEFAWILEAWTTSNFFASFASPTTPSVSCWYS